MEISITPAVVDLGFKLPTDWAIVLDVNDTEGKSNVFNGVLIKASTTVISFDTQSNTLTMIRGTNVIKFNGISMSVSKLIKHASKAFMIRYRIVKMQMTSAQNNGTEVLCKKSSVANKYSIHQVGEDDGSVGLIIIVNENELKNDKIVPGVALLDCGEEFNRMILSYNSGPRDSGKQKIKFMRLMGEYCVGILPCQNSHMGSLFRQKIQEYFSA
jgi:hypothetical protein